MTPALRALADALPVVVRGLTVAACAFAALTATATPATSADALTPGVRAFYAPTAQLDTTQVTDLRTP